MHFLLGYDRGSWREHLQPVTAAPATSPVDIAGLCLDEPAAALAVPIAHRPAVQGETVLVVGYGKPRVQIANRTTCRISHVDDRGRLQLDCPLTAGTSGAPVLRETGTGHEVVGIVSASNNERSIAYRLDGEEVLRAC